MKNGFHLIIDLKDCCKIENLSDKNFIKNFLFELTKRAKMQAIIKPRVLYYKHKNKEESGVTGFVIIADSHISIHTYPFKQSAYIDIFSCKKFNSDKIINYITKVFQPKILRNQQIKR